MTAKEQRVLPPDVYDTLEFSALAFGGIGIGHYFVCGNPHCYVGHLAFTGAIPHTGVLAPYGIGEMLNDSTVKRINRRKRVDESVRVTWPEYTRELNIVRGDS